MRASRLPLASHQLFAIGFIPIVFPYLPSELTVDNGNLAKDIECCYYTPGCACYKHENDKIDKMFKSHG
jgi:hypothetical protein